MIHERQGRPSFTSQDEALEFRLMMPAIRHIYISPGHNFRGHHGGAPGEHPILEVNSVESVAGKGLVGDRYFGEKPDSKGQVTFFALEVHRQLCEQFGKPGTPPSVYRRNVITEGLDLNALIGKEFELQGVRFLGTEESRPCHWMDHAVAPGAEEAMKGRGGLRAKILTTGRLRCGPALNTSDTGRDRPAPTRH